jgi:hypothetical protein
MGKLEISGGEFAVLEYSDPGQNNIRDGLLAGVAA